MSFFPDILQIKILDDDNKPIPSIAIMIRLFANHKNDYYLIPSISNDEGIIEVNRNWINKQINDIRNFFIMDYSSTLEDCQSKIEIRVMDKNEINKAIEGRKIYKDLMNIPDTEIQNLSNSMNFKYLPVTQIVEVKENKVIEILLVLK